MLLPLLLLLLISSFLISFWMSFECNFSNDKELITIYALYSSHQLLPGQSITRPFSLVNDNKGIYQTFRESGTVNFLICIRNKKDFFIRPDVGVLLLLQWCNCFDVPWHLDLPWLNIYSQQKTAVMAIWWFHNGNARCIILKYNCDYWFFEDWRL